MNYYINLVYSLAVFIIGLLFGSFFTLAIYRIPRHEDIIKTRSYCPNCKHKLGFFDCFPLLSYISTVGRCRYCNRPISIRYPLIELVTGFSFLLIYLIFGFSWQTLVLIICYIYIFLVIGVDVMKKKMMHDENTNNKNNEIQNNKKSGAINIDIIVAIVVFTIFFVSTIYTTRNYNSTLMEYKAKTSALNICMNKLNEAKFDEFDSLESANNLVNIDGVTFYYNVEILPYVKEGNVTVDNVNVIISTVTYLLNGNTEQISLKSIKMENE